MTILPSEDAAAMAVMMTDGCGLTIDGERVLCDDPRAKPDERCTPCMCRESAKAVLALFDPPLTSPSQGPAA